MTADAPDTSLDRARIAAAVDATPTRAVELDGGMVGTVYRVEFDDRAPVAVKVGDTPLENEARMLTYLDRESPLPVPEVYHAEADLLVLEYVDGDGRFDATAQRDVAEHVATLHECSAEAFGFAFETLSGPFRQSNPWTESWIEFFREHRLLAFARRAREEGALPESYDERVRTLADRLDDVLVEPDAPSLLHGDVYRGNVVVGDGRVRAFLDPAIYFGHDELELTYVDRPGVFGEAFLDRYRECRPIAEGYVETRRPVYRAFHALENVRFFGEEALDRLDETLQQAGV